MNPYSVQVADDISGGKRTGFTFAPEAGSQRLRDIINKGVEEADVLDTAEAAIRGKWENLKFYFMIGLPYETDEDVAAIYDLATKVLKRCLPISKRINVTVSVSNFVPKPHTPFQWAEQMDMEEMKRKHKILRDLFKGSKHCTLRIHDSKKSYLEGLLSRGDERTGDLIQRAFEMGAKLDDYRDNYDIWIGAAQELGIEEKTYLGARELDQELPWDMVDIGVDKSFLLRENEKAREGALTPDCRKQCSGCGMKKRFPNCLKIAEN